MRTNTQTVAATFCVVQRATATIGFGRIVLVYRMVTESLSVRPKGTPPCFRGCIIQLRGGEFEKLRDGRRYRLISLQIQCLEECSSILSRVGTYRALDWNQERFAGIVLDVTGAFILFDSTPGPASIVEALSPKKCTPQTARDLGERIRKMALQSRRTTWRARSCP
jgi:hypothetical protein